MSLASQISAARLLAGMADVIVQPNEREAVLIANRAVAVFVAGDHDYTEWVKFGRLLRDAERCGVRWNHSLLGPEDESRLFPQVVEERQPSRTKVIVRSVLDVR